MNHAGRPLGELRRMTRHPNAGKPVICSKCGQAWRFGRPLRWMESGL